MPSGGNTFEYFPLESSDQINIS